MRITVLAVSMVFTWRFVPELCATSVQAEVIADEYRVGNHVLVPIRATDNSARGLFGAELDVRASGGC